ncbi:MULTISPECIES: hypothetical protein [Pseudomonas]|uniref:Tetratricopeptide repeat protein n=1 Tax=Pseudomonas nitroreducens TaxID=46680 RepID=A0ABS0KMU5_PSENT|nr:MULTISPECIES: hypothetical protein [Pseudomonas]MBG6288901.1 hypothetical protein [Pseudomonas nitroreducens]MDG9857874.1 hypothetical protein [Pseudomonas nitroreducens]MDH1073631.1 hypothetical protein [Pseudomonas nitroreducens]NMZ61789.1 hypothetical protein [Pseudomonas nitroreducens]NMZ74533.1 hypothetical protein [Pseudomonas nitroreducens]
MRRFLLALLTVFSLNAVADDTWKPFPYDQKAFDYSGDKLREAWPRLTRGFGANYPFPDADWVVTMATRHPEALEKTVAAGTGFSGKPEEAQVYAEKLQDVWRKVFRGDFAQAKKDGLALGVGGQVPGMFAQVLYAMFLAPNQDDKQRLLEEVISYTDEAGPLLNADPIAQFGRAYAKARLAEDLPVPVVLKRGYTSEIPKELDALLAKQPNQPFALALYGGYEAGVIRKVGKLVGKMTYGVSADKMEQYFARSFRAADDLPIGHYEYANALGYVYGEDEQQKALEQLKKAVAIKPINAMEALEVAHAQQLLKKAQQEMAQR